LLGQILAEDLTSLLVSDGDRLISTLEGLEPGIG
jgi:hypothetical protein